MKRRLTIRCFPVLLFRGMVQIKGDTGTLNFDRLESRFQASDGRRPPEGGTPTGTVRPPGVTWFPQILNQAVFRMPF